MSHCAAESMTFDFKGGSTFGGEGSQHLGH